MTKKPVFKILSRLVDVRPEEAFSSVLMFFYFFLITSSVYIIIPVKLSLFLKQQTPERLPFAYLLTAIMIGFVVSLNSKLLHVMKRQLYISLCLLFFIANLLIFWVLFKLHWPWLSMIFWFWEDIFTVTSVTQFWILVNDIYHPRQAKRLIGFLVSGGLLGGVGGSLLASRLAGTIGTEDLLLICPFMLVFCLIIVNFIHKFFDKEKIEADRLLKEQKKKKIGYGKSFSLMLKNRHLILLGGIVVAAIVVTTLIDFQFISIVNIKYEDENSRTAFFGTFFMILLIFSSLLHIFSTDRILKNFGIRVSLMIAPISLLIGSFAILFIPAASLIYWAVLIKGTDKSLSFSLSQSVRELLYIPIPPEIKYKAKVFIDMFVNKLAKGLGAIFILVFFSILNFSIKQISFITIVFILVWIILNQKITKEYVNIVKKNLKIKWHDADKFVTEKIDIDMTKLVFDTLESKKRSSVLYAMNLFDLVKRENLSPELKKIITHKSDEIRASSMDSLLELDGEVFIPEIDDSLEEESLDAQMKEIMSLDVYQELMKDQIDKITSDKGEKGDVSRMEAAKALGMMDPSSPLIQNINKLLKDESPEVIQYAVESAGKLKRREFIHPVIQQLSNPSTYRIASQALVEYGTKITGTLKDYLSDSNEDIRLRKQIPDILAQIGTQRAADLLALELEKKDRDLEFKIIEALSKIRRKNPQIQFQEKIILPRIKNVAKKCLLTLIQIHDFIDDKKKAHLVKDLENNLAQSLKHIFDLLGLVHPLEDINKAYQNICVGTKISIDYSIELLDNILKKDVKEILIPLIDDTSLEEKAKKCRKIYKSLEKLN